MGLNEMVIMALLVGLLVGSFLNVVIHRLPLSLERSWRVQAKQILALPADENDEGKPFNIMTPPSHCPNCLNAIKPWHNIPLVGFLLLQGRCRHCAHPIAWRYPLVEALTGVVFAICAWKFGASINTLAAMVLSAYLIAMIFIDADTQLLPDQLTLPLMWFGIAFHAAAQLWHGTWGLTNQLNSVLGAMVGYMSLWTLFQLFKWLTGKEGMGYGDFKLLAALGAWLGVGVLPVIIMMSALVGLLFALLMKVAKNQPMPFGPYLAISGWIAMVCEQPIAAAIHWWLGLSGLST